MRTWPYILTVSIFPFTAIARCLYFQFDAEAATELTREHRTIQTTQVILLAGAVILCLRVTISSQLRYSTALIRKGFAVLAVMVLFLVMEESNWGQSYLKFATREWVKSGQNNAFSLHNLSIFQPFRHWLIILFGSVGLALIALRAPLERCDLRKDLLFFAPPCYFLYALVLILLSGVLREIARLLVPFDNGPLTAYRLWTGRFTEIAELGVAIAAIAYSGAKNHELVLGEDAGDGRSNNCAANTGPEKWCNRGLISIRWSKTDVLKTWCSEITPDREPTICGLDYNEVLEAPGCVSQVVETRVLQSGMRSALHPRLAVFK